MQMNNISQLFDKFAVAYQHSLYAIEQKKAEVDQKCKNARVNTKKYYANRRMEKGKISGWKQC